jgi:hypothetical protein
MLCLISKDSLDNLFNLIYTTTSSLGFMIKLLNSSNIKQKLKTPLNKFSKTMANPPNTLVNKLSTVNKLVDKQLLMKDRKTKLINNKEKDKNSYKRFV